MDQYRAEIIIAIIGGIITIVSLMIQKRQDKVLNKIDEKTIFIEKENGLRRKLNDAIKERDAIIHSMMILILDTNLSILKAMKKEGNITIGDSVFRNAEDLKKKFNKATENIDDINSEYELVLELTSSIQKEAAKQNK